MYSKQCLQILWIFYCNRDLILSWIKLPRNIIYQLHRATINQRRYGIKITHHKPFILLAFQMVKNIVKGYRKKSIFIRIYGLWDMKFRPKFVIYLTIHSCTNPLKIRIYTIPWSIPWNTCKYMQSLINTAIATLQNVIILLFF